MKGFINLALSFAREVTIGNEFQVALVACHMIGNVHFTALIYPELSHDYVMHRRRDLAPSKMVACQYKKKKSVRPLPFKQFSPFITLPFPT